MNTTNKTNPKASAPCSVNTTQGKPETRKLNRAQCFSQIYGTANPAKLQAKQEQQPQHSPDTRTVPADRPTAIKINQPYVEKHSPLPWETWTSETSDFIDIGTRQGYGEVARLAKCDLAYRDAQLIVASVNHAGKLAELLERAFHVFENDTPLGQETMGQIETALAEYQNAHNSSAVADGGQAAGGES